FFQAEDGIRDFHVTGVQTCALPIFLLSIFFTTFNISNSPGAVEIFIHITLVYIERFFVSNHSNNSPVYFWPGLLEFFKYLLQGRSEERRVGKECRSRWGAHQEKKKR